MKAALLVLAAGLGTRYGGLKQIDAVGPNGETIIDYSVYDAMKAGFGKVVFVIRHYFEDAFRDKVSARFDNFVKIAYAYQEIDSCLGDFEPCAGREKPWGTGHAILVARDVIEGSFSVVNADDYYGPNSFKTILDFISAPDTADNEHAMVGYTLRNTLSDYGVVSRGVCDCDSRMFLKKIVERKAIKKTADGARYFDPDGTEHQLRGDETVSMNLWGFQPSVFEHFKSHFDRFLEIHSGQTDAELLIPSVADELITSGKATIKVLHTDDPWFGVTYRQDNSVARRCIRELIDKGVYPERLWD